MRPLFAALAVALALFCVPLMPRHVVIADLPDLSDLATVAEPDPLNFAAEQVAARSIFVAVLPVPRPRPAWLDKPALLAEAMKWLNAGPDDLGVRPDLWCAAAINKMLERIGLRGTGSDAAASFAGFGRKLDGPEPGAIGVKRRYARGRLVGGHVVIVKAVEGDRVVAISPNAGGNRVRIQIYSRRAFYAWQAPEQST